MNQQDAVDCEGYYTVHDRKSQHDRTCGYARTTEQWVFNMTPLNLTPLDCRVGYVETSCQCQVSLNEGNGCLDCVEYLKESPEGSSA